jgi:ribose transport system substrate-binding protein
MADMGFVCAWSCRSVVAAAGLLVALVVAGGTATSAQGSGVKIGFVTPVTDDPFMQQIVDGAKAAAADTGVDLTVAGPAEGSGNPQLLAIHQLVDAGAQGIATAVTGDSMSGDLNDLIGSGIPVVQFNLHQTKVNGPYVGNRTKESGRILGQTIVDALGGASATGTVIIGDCFPGYDVLEDRAAGLLESLDLSDVTGVGVGLAPPSLDIVGPLDTTHDPATNYTAWQAALTAHPDARALIGLCGLDLPNLIALKAANPTSTFIAGGYDLTDASLAGIRDGTVFATIDQTPFMQGYIPVKILADTLSGASTVDLTQGGFIEAGTEVVTQSGVVEPFGLPALTLDQRVAFATKPTAAREYYRSATEGVVSQWASLVTAPGTESK